MSERFSSGKSEPENTVLMWAIIFKRPMDIFFILSPLNFPLPILIQVGIYIDPGVLG